MAVRTSERRSPRRVRRASVASAVLALGLLGSGTSCSVDDGAGEPGGASSVVETAWVGHWVPAEGRWSRAGVTVELLKGGEFRGDDACKVLNGRWRATSSERVEVEVGPTSGLACDFRFPLIALLQEPLQVGVDGSTLVLDAGGADPVELVRAPAPDDGASPDVVPWGSSSGDSPTEADGSGTIAVGVDGGDETFVLVAPEANGAEALLGGVVEVLGGCLGVAGSVVLWPPGTVVVSADPLTVGIPGFGVAGVGDVIAVSGGFTSRSSSTGGEETTRGVSIPAACPGPRVFHGGMVTEPEER